MPAPVSSNVFPSFLTPFTEVFNREEILDCGVALAPNDGARKSTSAAIAPLGVFALVGIIFGRGRGSV
jgi:hypothetical protein